MFELHILVPLVPIIFILIVVVGWFLFSFLKLIKLQWNDYRYNKREKRLQTHEGRIEQLKSQYVSSAIKYQTSKRLPWVLGAGFLSLIIGGLLWFFREGVDDKVFSTTLALAVSSPVLLGVWYFRDQNRLRELDRQHQDVTLKEFQQLQEWATGNIPDGYDGNSQKYHAITLQVSALHSLRPYLRGEFGESFKRGAYEIFVNVLKTQHQKLLATFEENQALTYDKIQAAIKKESLTQQINQIAKEEWFNLLVNHNFPTSGISLVGVDLSGEDKYLQHRIENKPLDLSFAQLQGAKFDKAQLQGVSLRHAQLECAKLNQAKLQGAKLREANLQGAELKGSSMQGAGLTYASLQMSALDGAQMQGAALLRCDLKGASLWGSNLQGADLKYAQLQGVLLNDACLQGADLRNAELQGAVLTDANVQGADTAHAKLQGVMSQRVYSFDFEGSASRLIVDRSEEPTDVSGLYGGENEPPMTQEAVNALEKELLQYRHSTTVSTIIQRIQQGAKNKPPYCDLTLINRGFYSLKDAENWTKELEKFQSK